MIALLPHRPHGPIQDPVAPPPVESETHWLVGLVERPGVVELALAAVGLVVAVLIALRLLRLVRETRNRAAVEDYLLGVEQALSGDLQGARKRLQRVLQEDPENHYARMLFGVVLADSGAPAEAHKHHLYLQRAFEVDSSRNDLALARSLWAVGHMAEAAAAARRGVAGDPDDVQALDFLFRTQLGAGLAEEAARTGQQLLPRLKDADRRAEVARQAAAAFALAGSVQLRAGARDRAATLWDEAHGLAADEPRVRVLAARLRAAETDVPTAVRELLAEHAPEEAPPTTLPVRLEDAGLPMLHRASEAAPALPHGIHALARLLPAARWQCSACLCSLPAAVARCPACGARDAAEATEPRLFGTVESPTVWMDQIDENTAHVRRLLDAALQGGDADARLELIELGPKATEELLHAAWRRGGDDGEVVAILREMGPEITPALFAAYGTVRDKRLLPLPKVLGGRSPATLVGRIVQGFGRQALPHFEGLLDSADRDQRKILIDYFIGLGDQNEFLRILDRFPPLEILHRLNRSDGMALTRFLAGVRPGGFVAEGLLLDRAFYREEELVRAIAEADHGDALIEVLERRGPSGNATAELIGHLADDPLAPVARRVLSSFGSEVVDYLLAAFTDLDRDAATRKVLGELLTDLGGEVVDRICACFGPTPSAIDEHLVSVLQAMGAGALEPLVQSYSRVGMLERWTAGLVRRHGNRRCQVIRALVVIGGDGARGALIRLRDAEKDANLKLRLSQGLHQLGPKTDADADSGGGHGQAG